MSGWAYETQWHAEGYNTIAGVDEAGRGCLFGDVVAAAVILPDEKTIVGLDDSKKLSPARRETLYARIVTEAVAVAVGVASAQEIDALNIKQASRLAMKRAVEKLNPVPQALLVDFETVDTAIPQKGIVHGDALSASIAAASIVAKVTRDRLCQQWDAQYPAYGILQHKGYATKLHYARLHTHGMTPMHRKTFLRKKFAQTL
jgi:ribonuclease HII